MAAAAAVGAASSWLCPWYPGSGYGPGSPAGEKGNRETDTFTDTQKDIMKSTIGCWWAGWKEAEGTGMSSETPGFLQDSGRQGIVSKRTELASANLTHNLLNSSLIKTTHTLSLAYGTPKHNHQGADI